MTHPPTIAGIVLAAGSSTRMGRHKPLLPLAGSTVLEVALAALTDGGVDDVIVVTGHRAEDLRPVIHRTGVREAFNPEHDRGMYSSVRAGVSALAPETEAFVLLPCDIPLVGSDTVRRLLGKWSGDSGPTTVCYPVHGGRRGHPPVVSAGLIPAILSGEPDGSLRELLAVRARAVDVEVDTPTIHWDIDTPEAYERIAAWAEDRISDAGG